jgi:hypothetical protein
MNPIAMIGAGALLLLLGAGLGYWLGSRRESGKTGEVQAELDAYRNQVTEHFSETAAHFQAIGAEYRKLYEHMATGAGQLCQGGQAVSFEPAEKLASGVVVDEPAPETEPSPPVDYEIAEPEAGERELPDIVSGEPAEAGPAAVRDTAEERPAEPGPTEAQADDAGKAEARKDDKSAAQELLAERELAVDDADAEKTIH